MDLRNPLQGLETRTPDTVGRYSRFERVVRLAGTDALKALDLNEQETVVLAHDLRSHLRPIQFVPETPWQTYFFLGGRGAGKTHAGAAACVLEAATDPDARILITGPTYSEIVKNQLEGPSGVLTLCLPWARPRYEKARRKLTWPNGAQATWLPASTPSKFRGFASSFVWADEIVAWDDSASETLDECYRINRWRTPSMGRRALGPRVVITTTPKPTPVFRHLLTGHRDGMVLARSTTFDNSANLDPSYVRYAQRLIGTRVGAEEFGGELTFDDLDKALFSGVDWNKTRLEKTARPETFEQIFVSLDPATGEGVKRDTTGIVVVGTKTQADGLIHAYVLQDASVNTPRPTDWAQRVASCYRAWESAATQKIFVSAETNAAGALVRTVLKQVDPGLRIRTYRAHESKALRAAPVSGLAEAGLVHLAGRFPDLERELSYFTGAENEKNDRVDAMCSAIYFWVCVRNRHDGVNAIDAEG